MALAVGDILGFALTQQYAGIDRGFETVSLVTAFMTAGYAVLEEASTKSLPLLRVVPKITPGFGMGSIGLAADVDNIGDSIAHGTHIVCKLVGTPTAQMNNAGVFDLGPIAPRERAKVAIVDNIATGLLESHQYELTVDYKDGEGEKMKQIALKGSIKHLIDAMVSNMMRRG